jgi:DNA repair exonuclease SbcCD ATPase subunit
MYDQKTKKKLINLYNNVISKTSKENKDLACKLNDLKVTLDLNHTLLFNILQTSKLDEELINDLKQKKESLWDKIESLIKLEQDTDIKTFILQGFCENVPIKINEEINDSARKINSSKNELIQKENTIKKLKQDLEKARNSALFKEARTEIFVSEPTPYNIEKNQELIAVKSILPKAISKHSNAKKEANKSEKEFKKLKEELKNLKKSLPPVYNNDDFFKKIKGYNINVDKDDENEVEEEEEKEESSDDSSSEESKNVKKKKKELAELTDKYNQLKKSYQQFQNKINEYKKSYKALKERVDNIYFNSIKNTK